LESTPKLVVNLTTGSVVCEEVEIADRARRRMRGLLGRRALPAGDGMLLEPAPSIHTAFMRFAFDAVFMDGTLRVLKTVERLPPWRIASARRARAVLELAEGEIARRGIGLGDHLGVVAITDEIGAVDSHPGWGLWNGSAVTTHPVDGDPSIGNGAAGSDAALDDQGRIDAARVLVVGTDRRFRSVAAALLTRRGYAVTLGDRFSNLGDLAKRERADVVVLDAGISLTDAAHGVAQLERLDPHVGLVVVGEEPEDGLSTMRVLSKWGSFAGLYRAIERARSSHPRRI
jgi:uncharacterized membrane protein (UPF0127 family)/CheY-like chemotaxis protein